MTKESKNHRIDADLIPALQKYSDGSISDCIRAVLKVAQGKQEATFTDADKVWLKDTIELIVKNARRGS